MFKSAPTRTDGNGQALMLGREIGKGGEGTVYEVIGRLGLVAKIFHSEKQAERAPKISAMIPAATPAIKSFCAWPEGIVFEGRRAVGFLMPAITDRKEIHVLHGVKSRKAAFPKASFGFLVRVALNVSRAVAALHDAGIVVGDFNDRGILVGRDATVRLIDCDSFQIVSGGSAFLCHVGMPNFTPPELQGVNLGGQRRTANHDAFSLATLIFLLLFMGRHPFAGRGTAELDVAIKEFRYAYSQDTTRTRTSPPPLWEDVTKSAGSGLATFFERAFGPLAVSHQNRPTAAEWVGILEQLEKSLVTCSVTKAHVFSSAVASCPWCSLEARTNIDLFDGAGISAAGAALGAVDVESIWKALGALSVPGIPQPRPAPRLDALTPAPLPSAVEHAINEFKNLRTEEHRARSVAEGVDRYIAQLVGRLTRIEIELAQRHAPLRQAAARSRLFERPSRLDSDWLSPAAVALGLLVVAALTAISGLFLLAAWPGFRIDLYDVITGLSISLVVAVGLLIARFLRRFLAAYCHRRLDFCREAALKAFPDLHADWRLATSKKEALCVEAGRALDLAELMAARAAEFKDQIIADTGPMLAQRDIAAAKAAADRAAAINKLQALASAASNTSDQLKQTQRLAEAHYHSWQTKQKQRGSELKQLRDNNKADQLERYLDQFFISNATIQGITPTLKTALRSHGIETAADIIKSKVAAANGFGPVRTQKMEDWKNKISASFTYDPTKGLDPKKVELIERRFQDASRRCARDIKILHDDIVVRITKLNQAIPEAKMAVNDTTVAAAQAVADRNALAPEALLK